MTKLIYQNVILGLSSLINLLLTFHIWLSLLNRNASTTPHIAIHQPSYEYTVFILTCINILGLVNYIHQKLFVTYESKAICFTPAIIATINTLSFVVYIFIT